MNRLPALVLLFCGLLLTWSGWLGAAGGGARESVARDAVCIKCHDEMEAKPILSIYQTRHGVKADKRTPVCQDCHGESTLHANTPQKSQRFPPTDVPFPKKGGDHQAQDGMCLACHQINVARHWLGSQHERQGVACVACHTLHIGRDALMNRETQAKACLNCHPTERMQLHLPSAHPVNSGKLVCGDCHNPHGSQGPKLLLRDSVNDTCFNCHAEKRGPFLWEHAPASDDCLLCHTPHGSTARPLLKMRSPWLCQQCHSSSRHPATAYSATSGANTTLASALNATSQLPLHGCANCHSQVHGSNHPGGTMLLR